MTTCGRAETAQAILDAARARDERTLNEHDAKALLNAYGLDIPAGEVFADEDGAVGFARDMGGSAVLKLIGSAILHKSERGLVSLGVDGDDRVRAEFRRLSALAVGDGTRVLVEQMLHGTREFMIGMKRDELFGPVVLFGVGGIFAEAYRDVSLAGLPLRPGDAESLLGGIRAQALLGPIRGLPSVDRSALLAAIEAVAQIAMEYPEIVEIDVNPLIIEGSRPVAADALIVTDPGLTDPVVSQASALRPNLRAVFAPRSVVVVGASDDLSKWGGRVLSNLVDGGFPGDVFAVNPRAERVLGHRCYSGVDKLPAAPDLAIIAVASGRVCPVIDQCVERGVAAAVVISSGFSETGEEGAVAEAALAARAQAGDLTLVGPNCMGVISTHGRLNAIGFVPLRPRSGGLSVVTQSGNIGIQLLMEAERRGIGIDKYVTVGNEAGVSVVDVLEELGEDPRTEALLVYLEGVRKSQRFSETVSRVTARKPIVFLRGGLTESGSRAAASHSGAMACRADVFLAVARHAGSLVCTDSDEGLDAVLCLANLPPTGGPRVAIITLGGGWGVLTADEVVRCGLTVTGLSPGVVRALDSVLPDYWSRANPVDMVGAVDVSVALTALDVVTRSSSVDAVLFMGVLGSPATGHAATQRTAAEPTAADRELLGQARSLMDVTGKPIICVPFSPIDTALAGTADGQTPVVLSSPATAVRALAGLVQYSSYRRSHAEPGSAIRF